MELTVLALLLAVIIGLVGGFWLGFICATYILKIQTAYSQERAVVLPFQGEKPQRPDNMRAIMYSSPNYRAEKAAEALKIPKGVPSDEGL